MGRLNPHMVTLAREYRQMPQVELSRLAGMAQGTLSKIENGQITPTDEQLNGIGRALGYPRQFFFQETDFRNLSQVFYRKYNTTQGTAKSVRALINILREHAKKLLTSVEIEEDRVPRVDLDGHCVAVERLANEVRLVWNVRPGPIANVTETLERAGVLIIKCDLGTDKIAGISMRDNELPPMVFMNHLLPGDRWRFTLAHELGHLIMHHHRFLLDKDTNVETEGSAFASAFLMPASDIRSQLLGRLSLEKLAHLKRVWGVSMQALIMRAAALERITDNQKRRLFVEMSRLGYRKDEPVEISKEEPRSLVKFHLKDLGYDAESLGQILCIYPEELPRLYPGVGVPALRLLKT